MQYGFLLLNNYIDKNNFDQTDTLTLQLGNPTTIYFRLVTLRAPAQVNTVGRYGDSTSTPFDLYADTLRFLPLLGTIAYVSFSSIDNFNSAGSPCERPGSYGMTNVPATQVIPSDDASIFSIAIPAGFQFAPNTMSVNFNDGTNVYQTQALSDISQMDTSSTDRFFC
jgi:hypothetical protein